MMSPQRGVMSGYAMEPDLILGPPNPPTTTTATG